MLLVLQLGADRHDDLADMDPCHRTLRFSEGTSHAGLEPVGARARQHLVDADDVEGVQPHSDVEAVLATALHHVLVGADACGLQGFRGELLVLVGHHVATEWKLVHLRLLPTQVKDADLRIGDPSAETGLWVRLVLTVPVTASRTTTHGDSRNLSRTRPPPAAKWRPSFCYPSSLAGIIETEEDLKIDRSTHPPGHSTPAQTSVVFTKGLLSGGRNQGLLCSFQSSCIWNFDLKLCSRLKIKVYYTK